jgi:hypothetical protein
MKKQTAKQIQCTPEIQSSLNLHARRFCGKVAELHHCFLEPRRCAMSFASSGVTGGMPLLDKWRIFWTVIAIWESICHPLILHDQLL